MRIAVTGSIATDHLMTFPGRFTESLVADRLDHVSLSFLVDDLQIRRGGVGPNIAFGMASLGLTPVLVGAAGEDFADYRSWLRRHGVDTDSVRVSEFAHTARFVCTTDADNNQIASFYSGAMAEAREIELGPVADRLGGLELVVIAPNDPEAMLRHTDECRFRGIPFAADPSQQLARMDGPEIRLLVDGAEFLFTNQYEAALIEQKTGWTSAEIRARVTTRVTTLGAGGSMVETADGDTVVVTCPTEKRKADPTGVGDAYRAGYLTGWAWGVSPERSCQLGSLLATYVIETVGTQEYELGRAEFLSRLAESYGEPAAAEIDPHLNCLRP